MGAIRHARDTLIRMNGRRFLLSRTGDNPMTIIGYAPPADNTDVIDSVSQRPLICQCGLLPDPAYTPKDGDELREFALPGVFYTLSNASPVLENETLIGWVLVAKGGS